MGPNGTLDDLIKQTRGNLKEDVIRIQFAQLVNFIEFLQTKGIMHRDLKPQNIMLDANYNLKVIDFGDARKVFEELDEDEKQEAARRGTFVGTVNYQSPEVINSEEQSCAIDIWAMGCILFKMFVGTVPFKGTNPMTVYKDVKNRNIQWPPEDQLQKIMSREACDLINRMIQIEPKHRLGHDLESIKLLKTHPFFEGIDFEEVSSRQYVGLAEMVKKCIPSQPMFSQPVEPDPRQSLNNVVNNPLNPLMKENEVVIKGQLCKRNWYGNKQIRFFELYRYGEIKYYKDMKDYKGSITINAQTKVVKVAKTTIKVFCARK